MKLTASTVTAAIFLGIAVAGAVLCFKLLLDGSPGSALIAALIVIVCTVVGRPQLFKTVELGLQSGLRVELRELQENVRELRILTEAFAKFVFWHQKADGRWGGPGQELQNEITEDVVNHLQKMGLTASEIEKLRDVQRPYLRFDYAHEIIAAATPLPEHKKEWDEFLKSTIREGIGEEPGPDALERALRDAGAWNDAHAPMLQRYRTYWAPRAR